MTDPNAATAAATVAVPAAAPAAAPVAPPAAPAIPWMPADADAELIGHAQNAGWQSPIDAVKSHRELQRLFGADRHGRTIVLPKEDATPAEMADFYTKLGRPETPDGYKLPVPDGDSGEFAKAAAQWMHEAGVPGAAARAIAAKWNEHQAGVMKAAQEAEQNALAAEHSQLSKDWGAEAPMRKELARRAAERLGMDAEGIDALEKAVGFSKTMKALAKMGDLMRESGAEGLGEIGAFGRTPEGAKAKRAQLMADADWRKGAMVPNSRQWAELQELDRIIAGA